MGHDDGRVALEVEGTLVEEEPTGLPPAQGGVKLVLVSKEHDLGALRRALRAGDDDRRQLAVRGLVLLRDGAGVVRGEVRLDHEMTCAQRDPLRTALRRGAWRMRRGARDEEGRRGEEQRAGASLPHGRQGAACDRYLHPRPDQRQGQRSRPAGRS